MIRKNKSQMKYFIRLLYHIVLYILCQFIFVKKYCKSCPFVSAFNFFTFLMSRTVSRVMSWMIIYLGLPSPAASSDPPESEPGRLIAFYSVLLRMGFTWLLMLPPAR